MKKLEPVIILLTGLVIFFTLLLFVSEKLFPDDGQIFQVLSGLITGFGGALLMRTKPANKNADADVIDLGGSVVSRKTEQTTTTVPVQTETKPQ